MASNERVAYVTPSVIPQTVYPLTNVQPSESNPSMQYGGYYGAHYEKYRDPPSYEEAVTGTMFRYNPSILQSNQINPSIGGGFNASSNYLPDEGQFREPDPYYHGNRYETGGTEIESTSHHKTYSWCITILLLLIFILILFKIFK